MEQALFRIGGYYKDGEGSVLELRACRREGFASVHMVRANGRSEDRDSGYCRLTDGRDSAELDREGWVLHLIPGELHNFDGQWLPVEEKAEQPRAPYFAEALEDMAVLRCPSCHTPEGSYHLDTCPRAPSPGARRIADCLVRGIDPNAAMIARDGPARPVALPATTVAQEATSHAPLAGLTVLMERDHRFGLFRF